MGALLEGVHSGHGTQTPLEVSDTRNVNSGGTGRGPWRRNRDGSGERDGHDLGVLVSANRHVGPDPRVPVEALPHPWHVRDQDVSAWVQCVHHSRPPLDRGRRETFQFSPPRTPGSLWGSSTRVPDVPAPPSEEGSHVDSDASRPRRLTRPGVASDASARTHPNKP